MESGLKPLEAAISSVAPNYFHDYRHAQSLLAVVFLPLVLVTGIIGRSFANSRSLSSLPYLLRVSFHHAHSNDVLARLGPRGEGDRTWVERTVGALFEQVTTLYGRSLYFFCITAGFLL